MNTRALNGSLVYASESNTKERNTAIVDGSRPPQLLTMPLTDPNTASTNITDCANKVMCTCVGFTGIIVENSSLDFCMSCIVWQGCVSSYARKVILNAVLLLTGIQIHYYSMELMRKYIFYLQYENYSCSCSLSIACLIACLVVYLISSTAHAKAVNHL